ncbi:unnamed protein product [Ceutorhynchus assimilis]|uniref:Tesmin/TSO1-like CXC domain-containing protein n=1 Tax=Ceutorhynchus assimilis TaxID=467358 RepID=A0A9N9MH02_9CUCU|nr:unnamed protein product [Ceutorhynchus assimilis]
MAFDFSVCFVCQKRVIKSQDVLATQDSLSKIKIAVEKRVQYGDKNIVLQKLQKLFSECETENMLAKKPTYHRKCYSELTNKTNLERLKKKVNVVSSKNSTTHMMRPSRSTFDSEKCVLCQEVRNENLYNISSTNMSAKLKQIGICTSDLTLKQRLILIATNDDPLAAVVYDMKYHLSCFRKHERASVTAECSQTQRDTTINATDIVNAEIICFVKNTLLGHNETSRFLDMNVIQKKYISFLANSGIEPQADRNYKPFLKNLLSDNIPTIVFYKPKKKTDPEQVLLNSTLNETVNIGLEAKKQLKLQKISEAAKMIRDEIQSNTKWIFQGSFDNYTDPPVLFYFTKLVLFGHNCITESPEGKKSVSMVCQHILQASVSDKQGKNISSEWRRSIETPLSVGLALDVHKNFRSKKMIDTLHKLNLSIDYQKVLRIEDSLKSSLYTRLQEINIDVCPPNWLSKNKFLWFAIDNIDFLEATPSGMDTLHGTVTAIIQEETTPTEKNLVLPKLVLDRSTSNIKSSEKLFHNHNSFRFPNPAPKKLESIICGSNINFSNDNLCWIISSISGSPETTLGTWSSFNSLKSFSSKKCNVSLLAPLIPFPPTIHDILYKAIKEAQAVNYLANGNNAVTVITFDMQLYDLAMKIWVADENIQKQYIFRPGELHVTFWALAALGKYIEGSGIDQAWIEAGMYSASTVSRILEGKQYYRSLEAHMTTVLALCDFFIEKIISKPEIIDYYRSRSTELLNIYKEINNKNMDATLKEQFRGLVKNFGNLDQHFSNTYSNSKGTFKFICNYIKQFETILTYIKATREKQFDLHLENTDALIKYFFAHDHLSYARLLPLYLSSMAFVRKHHPEIWQEFVSGNFSVSKSDIPFTAIGPDHAIEHENRKLKVSGGIVGITKNMSALNRYFMIASELSQITDKFQELISPGRETKNTIHHEFHSPTEQRIKTKYLALKEVFATHISEMPENGEVCNLLTGKILDKQIANDILNRDELGKERYKIFENERITEGKKGIWDPMQRMKLNTFKNSNAKSKTKQDEKILEIREERSLLQRLLLVSRTRQDIDLKKAVGEYEFGSIPRSLFAADGSLLLPTDKFKLMQKLEDISKNSEIDANIVDNLLVKNRSVILVDGMALVQCISKSPSMKTCKDFANVFVSMLTELSKAHDEVHLIFDTYKENSLKHITRTKRTKKYSGACYHVSDGSIIQNITLKDFLSNIKTKMELTEYLAKKVLGCGNFKHVVVSYNNNTISNMPLDNLEDNNHEEADTILILHGVRVTQRYGKEIQMTVYSPDTDVFVLLVSFYENLPDKLRMITNKGKIKKEIDIAKVAKTISIEHKTALIGFHAFTGTDITGRFSRISKEFCSIVFLELDKSSPILRSLALLGTKNTYSTEMMESLEEFVCLLYRNKVIKNLADLRWYLFSTKNQEGENLPPTVDALNQHILRANYIAAVWRCASESKQNLPEVRFSGWHQNNEYLEPVPMLSPPAPKAIIKLIKCGCKKGCGTNTCSCKKNKIVCTEACGCSVAEFPCSNGDLLTPVIIEEDEDYSCSDDEDMDNY